MSKKFTRILAGLLSAMLVFNALTLDTQAYELSDNVEISDVSGTEEVTTETADVSSSDETLPTEDEILPEEEETLTEDVSSNEEVGEMLDELFEEDLSDVFYRSLSAEEINMKARACADVLEAGEAVEGKDYAAGQVFTIAASEEEAEKVRLGYEKATGYKVDLVSYSYGVAVYNITGEPKATMSADIKAMNRVQCMVAVGASSKNNLPAVYPNYRRYADAHEYQVETGHEGFTDPFLNQNMETDTAGYYQWYHNMINDKFAWKLIDEGTAAFNLSAVGVYVLDSGINGTHEDFAASSPAMMNFVHETEFVGGDEVMGDDLENNDGTDWNGHGTNVCGIIGSDANYIGGRGVAAGVKLISGRVLDAGGSGWDADIMSGLRWALNEGIDSYNIKVINMSLGGSFSDTVYLSVLEALRNKGVLVVAAAGNENTPSAHYPSAYPYVVSVAALNSDYQRSAFSNYGTTVDIAAPGGEAKPQKNFGSETFNDYRNEQLWTTGTSYYINSIEYEGELFLGMQGTSQATPVVSAAAAYVFAAHPDYTPAVVEGILKGTARKIKTDKAVGAGCVDIAAALGIAASARAPYASYEDGSVIEAGAPVYLRADNDVYDDDWKIFYTLDGTKPDPFKNPKSTREYDDGVNFDKESGKVTLKAVTYLYGIFSPVTELHFSFAEKQPEYVTIQAKNDSFYVAVGKKLTLQAQAEPVASKKDKFIWHSESPEIATVNSKGVVTGKAIGSAFIYATLSGSDYVTGCEFITVKEPANQLVFVSDENPIETFVLEEGESIHLGEEILRAAVYPEAASQSVSYTSSDSKIATVSSNDGDIYLKGVKSGTVKLTAQALDGTGIKTTVKIKVVTPLKAVSIKSKTGFNAVAQGYSINLKAEYNNGKSTPDSKKITWEIVEGSEYASIDQNGKLKAVNLYDYYNTQVVKVQASGQGEYSDVKSNILEITIYPQSGGLKSVEYFWGPTGCVGNVIKDRHIDSYGDEYSYMEPQNPQSCPYFSFKSSNPSAISIDNEGNFVFMKAGFALITMTALDGSGKKGYCYAESYGTYEEGFGLVNKSGTNVLYPGKSITFGLTSSVSSKLASYFRLRFDNEGENKSGWASISGTKVKAKKEMKQVTPGTPEDIILSYRYYEYDYNYGYILKEDYLSCATLEYYPAGASKVNLSDTNKSMHVGDAFVLGANIEPANACQKYYTYKSSNTKVCKVYDDGTVVAVGNGTAKITVTAGDGSKKSSICTVNVCNPVTSLVISHENNGYVAKGKSTVLKATVNEDAGNKKLTWSLSNPEDSAYASIDARTGKFTAKVAGKEIYVKAAATDGSGVYDEYVMHTTSQTRFGQAPTKVDLLTGVDGFVHDAGCFSMYEGHEVDNEVSVKVDKPAIADVSYSSGTLEFTPLKAGKAKVTLTALDGSGLKKVINITVRNPVTDLIVSGKNGQTGLAKGQTLQMVVTANKDATDKSVSWSVDGTGKDYVSISSKGVLSITKELPDFETYVTVKATAKYSGPGEGNEVIGETKIALIPAKAASVKVSKDSGNWSSSASVTIGTIDIEGYQDEVYYNCLCFDKNNSSSIYQSFDAASSDTKVVNVTTGENGFRVNAVGRGKATVTVKAMDGSGKKATIKVKVVEPLQVIAVSTKNGNTAMAGDTSLQLVAHTDETVDNKAVRWEMAEEGVYEAATLSAKGVLKIDNKKLKDYMDAGMYVRVRAVATDPLLNDQVNSSWLTIYVFFKQKIEVMGNEGVNLGTYSMKVGEYGEFSFVPEEMGEYPGYGMYQVTYTSGYGAMRYMHQNDMGTGVKFLAAKAGTVTVTVKAMDGSGIKTTFKIKISK